MAQVELVDLCKSYGDVQVVRGVSLTVNDGEFLVLVGPSGCGKSTTLRMIAGLEDITEGELRIDGERVNEVSPKDRDIGMVFQSYALYPHMTVFENVAFGLTLRKVPAQEIETRVRVVADSLGLGELLDRKPGELSGGQRQRVAMGRAIARQPRLFLFDEPLSNLDAALRVQMRGELLALHQQVGTTMVYVTHDQVEAMTLATRIAILDGGVLQQVGTPQEVYQHPANRFVAGFIGSPAMNFLEGRVSMNDDGPIFEGDGNLQVPLGHLNGPMPSADAASLGIRPHDLVPGEGPLEGEVEVVEALGWEAFAHVRVHDLLLVARLQGDEAAHLTRGDRLRLRFDPAHAQLFDNEGRAVGGGPVTT